MTIDDLTAKIEALSPNQAAGIHHDTYADFWPPGEPDERAREACYNYAKALGCRIENDVVEQTVWFVKVA